MGNSIAQFAMQYASLGWRLIPIIPGAKRPALSNWQNVASCDEDTVGEWWSGKFAGHGIGIVLGEVSGVCDVECDSPDAEQLYSEMCGGKPIITPTYVSSRGKHRLFQWSPELPFPGKNGFKIGTLEFRTGNDSKGAQSLLPPSVHPSGIPYQWEPGLSPAECDLAPLPPDFLARVAVALAEGDDAFRAPAPGPAAKPAEYWKDIAGGVSAGGRNQAAAEFIGMQLRNTADLSPHRLETMRDLIHAWNSRNQPPLPDKELDTTFNSIRKREVARRAQVELDEEADDHGAGGKIELPAELGGPEITMLPNRQISPAQVGERFDPPAGIAAVEGWCLLKVMTTPITWRLYSPMWAKRFGANGEQGWLDLSTDQLLDFRLMKKRAVEVHSYLFRDSFRRTWIGSKDKATGKVKTGLLNQLMTDPPNVAPPAGLDRKSEVAQQILKFLYGVKDMLVVGVKECADPNGMPRRGTNMNIYFKFESLLVESKWNIQPLTKAEASDSLHSAGIRTTQRYTTSSGDRRDKFNCITPAGVAYLERLANAGIDSAPEEHEPRISMFDPAVLEDRGHLPNLYATTDREPGDDSEQEAVG